MSDLNLKLEDFQKTRKLQGDHAVSFREDYFKDKKKNLKDVTGSNTDAQIFQKMQQSGINDRRIIEILDEGVWSIDRYGKMIYVNSRAAELLGYAREEMMGCSIQDFIHPEYLNNMQSEWILERQISVCSKECCFKRKDGTDVWFSFKTVPFYEDDRFVGVTWILVDTTERRRVEKALRESEERFRIAAQSASDFIYEWDLKDNAISWFGNVDESLGYSAGEFSRTRDRWIKALHPEDRDRVIAAVNQHLKTREPFFQEYRVMRKDGTICYWVDRGTALWDHEGTPFKWIGVNTDITSRKKVEEALRDAHERLEKRVQERTAKLTEANEQFRLLFENSWEAILIADDKGNFLQANRAACDLLGCSRDQVLSRAVSDLVTTEILDLHENFKSYFELGHASGEFSFIGPDGRQRTAEYSVCQVAPHLHLCILRDITSRKRAEEKIKSYAEIFKNIQIGIMVWHLKKMDDIDTFVLTAANPAAMKFAGIELEGFIGRLASKSFPSIFNTSLPKVCAEVIRTGKTAELGEMRCSDQASGEIFSVKAFPLPNQCVGIALENITQQKRVEEKILEVSGREQRRIGQDIHDGLCQQLTGVAFMIKALERKLSARSLIEAKEVADVREFVNQSIAQARILARGLYPIELEMNGLAAALQELAYSIEKRFDILCHFECVKPIHISDRAIATHVYRIAQEALSNSIKHGKARQVSITLIAESNKFTLAVEDDGIGFPNSLEKGRGMGLHIMNYRARMIGGSLMVCHNEGKGTLIKCSFQNEEEAEKSCC